MTTNWWASATPEQKEQRMAKARATRAANRAARSKKIEAMRKARSLAPAARVRPHAGLPANAPVIEIPLHDEGAVTVSVSSSERSVEALAKLIVAVWREVSK